MLACGVAALAAASSVPVPGDTGLLEACVSTSARHALEYLFGGYVGLSLVSVSGIILYTLGLLLPDVDSETSTLGRRFHLPLGHRTWTHSLYPAIAFIVLGIWLRPLLWLGLGYLAHLWCDSLSRQGICWLYPIPGFSGAGDAKVKNGHWVKLYRTGGLSETLVMSGVCAVCAAVLVASVYLMVTWSV